MKQQLKLIGILFLTIVCSIGLYSCENNDDEKTESTEVPTGLIGTWYMTDGTSITFNEDGTGTFTEDDGESTAFKTMTIRTTTRGLVTTTFTYTYNPATKQLIISVSGATEVLTIVSLGEGRLVLKTNYGEIMDFSTTKPEEKPEEPATALDEDLLTSCKWERSGQLMYEFQKGEKPGTGTVLRYWYEDTDEDGVDERHVSKDKYVINGNLLQIYLSEEDGYLVKYKAKIVNGDVLVLTYTDKEDLENSDYGFFVVYKDRNEKATIGPATYLYNKTWNNGYETLEFHADNTVTVKAWIPDEGYDTYTTNYSYDSNTHQIVIDYDGDKESHTVSKLTEDILIVGSLVDGKMNYTEYRIW